MLADMKDLMAAAYLGTSLADVRARRAEKVSSSVSVD